MYGDNIKLKMSEHFLTDGSSVWDVDFGSVHLCAVTEKDARDLVEKLAAAVEAHTNDTVNYV